METQRGQAQYSEALPVRPIYAMQLHRSTGKSYHRHMFQKESLEIHSYMLYCNMAAQENVHPLRSDRLLHINTCIPGCGGMVPMVVSLSYTSSISAC